MTISTVPTTTAATTGGAAAAASPAAPIVWKLEANVMMTTNSSIFKDEYDSSPTGLALTLAERMNLATGAPMSRFAFYLPNPSLDDPAKNVLFCQNNNSGAASAFARAANSSYTCTAQHKVLNTSIAPANATNGTNTTTSSDSSTLLQVFRSSRHHHRRSFTMLQADDDSAAPLQFEVAIYPPTKVLTDTLPAAALALTIAKASTSGDEPERKFLPTGFWTYKPGPGVKFHGLFPGTVASMPGQASVKRQTSIPLGPNPGGHGATMAPPPGFDPSKAKPPATPEEYFKKVDEVINEANTINTRTKISLKELADSMARASAVHSAWMNMDTYQLSEELGGPPMLANGPYGYDSVYGPQDRRGWLQPGEVGGMH